MAHLDDLRERLAYLEQSDVLAGAADEVRAEIAAAEAAAKPKPSKPRKRTQPKE